MQPGIRRNPPRQGEHTDEVLKECGYGPGEIAQLRGKKIIL
jgi:crotonobetainyl-CoA:carnitine CoA-transferase CaiB-like acyl-CoA transferase